LAQQLTDDFGKGWSEQQLRHCLRLAETFPDEQILSTVRRELSWSHLNDQEKLESTPISVESDPISGRNRTQGWLEQNVQRGHQLNPDCPLALQSQSSRVGARFIGRLISKHRRSPIHRAIDLYNNRAAPVKRTPEGVPLLRSGCHCERSAAIQYLPSLRAQRGKPAPSVIASQARQSSTLRHCERSAAIQSFTGFSQSKMANVQFGFQKPNELSGLNKMRKEGIN